MCNNCDKVEQIMKSFEGMKLKDIIVVLLSIDFHLQNTFQSYMPLKIEKALKLAKGETGLHEETIQ